MMKALSFSSITLCVLVVNTQAQQVINLQDSKTIKLHILGGNSQEIAHGISYQYYSHKAIGWQIQASFLRVGNGHGLANSENPSIKGSGLLLMPEFRYFPNRKAHHRYVSFYFATTFVLKYNHAHISHWQWEFDEYNLISYQRFTSGNNRIFALGLMPKIGWEAYIGKSKRFLLDVSMGIGVNHNWISSKGNLAPDPNEIYGFISSNNQFSGTYPYVNYSLALGYRLL